MPKCHFLFSAVFGSRNLTQEIFSELDEINARHLIIPRSFQNTGEAPEGSPGGPTRVGGAAKGGRPPMVWDHQDSTDIALPPT